MEYILDQTMITALYIAEKLSKKLNYPDAIPNSCFLAAIFIEPHGSLYSMHTHSEVPDDVFLETVYDCVFENSEHEYTFYATTLRFNDETFNLQNDILTILDLSMEKAELRVSYEDPSINSVAMNIEDAISVVSVLYPDIYAPIYSYVAGTVLSENSEDLFFTGSDFEDISVQNQEETSSKTKSTMDIGPEFELPENVSGFLRVLNTQYSPDDELCPICGRDEELKKLITILAKYKKPNCVLIGDPGVGKTAIVEKFTWQIVTGNCPEKYKDTIILVLDITSIVADTQYRGSAERRFKDLIYFLEHNPNCILFIDEIHLLLGAGACRDGDLDLANALKPLLARSSARVIGATTMVEYEKYFSKDSALQRRFEKIEVREPRSFEVYPMVKNQIKILSDIHNTSINQGLVKTAILYASCFNAETRNPDRTLDLIDQAMARAELDGRTAVRKKDIIGSFDIYMKIFNNMSIEEKKVIAYHESGHYLVHRFSENLYDSRSLAVSIMPAENYYGVTVFESTEKCNVNTDEDYFISVIASMLAGRVAEEIFTKTLTSDAASDLQNATELATKIVTKYGLIKELGNRVYLRKEHLTPETSSKINSAVDDLLNKATQRAKTILQDNMIYLNSLVEQLVKKGILTDSEIEKLFVQIKNEKKSNN